MNIWEQLALAFVTSAAESTPLFVHSQQGLLVLNASENLLSNIVAVLAARKPAAASPPSPVPVVPITAQAAS